MKLSFKRILRWLGSSRERKRWPAMDLICPRCGHEVLAYQPNAIFRGHIFWRPDEIDVTRRCPACGETPMRRRHEWRDD